MTDKALTVGQVAASVETKLDRIDFTEEERSLLQAALQAAKLADVEIQVVPKPEELRSVLARFSWPSK